MSTAVPPSPTLGELPPGPARDLVLRALEAQVGLVTVGVAAPPRVAQILEPIVKVLQDLTLFTLAGAEVTGRCREEIDERLRAAHAELMTASQHNFEVSEAMRALFTAGGPHGEVA